MSRKSQTEIWTERVLVVVALSIATYLSMALTENQFADDVHELRQLTRTMADDTSG